MLEKFTTFLTKISFKKSNILGGLSLAFVEDHGISLDGPPSNHLCPTDWFVGVDSFDLYKTERSSKTMKGKPLQKYSDSKTDMDSLTILEN